MRATRTARLENYQQVHGAPQQGLREALRPKRAAKHAAKVIAKPVRANSKLGGRPPTSSVPVVQARMGA